MNATEHLKHHWPLLMIVVIWFVAFFDVNSGQSVFGFRDSAYFYFPYYQWIDQQWQNGAIPLWNPFCDQGYPVVADGSSSVFYPAKLIFFFRSLSYPARYGIYVSIHVLWAALTTYFVTYRLSKDSLGAGLAGFSYAFGGSVLFQVSNVIFLVSASWLPLGIYFILTMSKKRKTSSAIGLGVVAAMMILGGDPQMAYLCGVLCFFSLLFSLYCNRHRYPSRRQWLGSLGMAFRRLVLFAIVTGGLAAIQIFPSFYWSQQSERAHSDLDVEAKSIEPTGYLASVYKFSQPPWSLVEMVFPNITGQPFPVSTRWASALAGADRIWTPSLYVGLLTFLLALTAFRFRSCLHRQKWLTIVALIFAVGSLGWYGAIWLINELSIVFAGNHIGQNGIKLGPQVGGLYWIATILLPGFDMFRYPAKLFTVASSTICILAGIGFAKQISQFNSKLVFGLAAVVVLSVLGFFVDQAFVDQVKLQCGNHTDPLFGPINYELLPVHIHRTLLHSITVAAAMLVVIIFCQRFRRHEQARVILLGIIFIDVGLANYWLTAKIDSSVFEAKTQFESDLERLDIQDGLLQIIRPTMVSTEWKKSSSENRLTEVVEFWRESVHPKFHLQLQGAPYVNLIGSFTSIEHRDLYGFRRLVVDQTGINRKLVNGFVDLSNSNEPKLRFDHSKNLKFRLIEPIDLNRSSQSPDEKTATAENAELRLLGLTANTAQLKIKSQKKVLLLCNLRSDDSWQIELRRANGEIAVTKLTPSGRFFSTVDVPAGLTEVVLRYSPREFWAGMYISIASWIALLVAVLFVRNRSR